MTCATLSCAHVFSSLSPPPSLSLSLSTDLSEAIVHVEPFECVEDGGNPYLGSQVTMRCTAEGDPLPQVTWFYNEVTPVLEKGNFTNVIYQQDNRTLIISPFRSFNWGHYHCQSENVIGQKSSNSILIGFQGMMYKTIMCTCVALFPALSIPRLFNTACFIGVSQSKPHTNHYEKITMPIYISM